MIQNTSMASVLKLAKETASPAIWATVASRGRWKMVRHLAMVDRALMALEKLGESRRLMVFMPPRHGKSELISKWDPAYHLGTHPNNEVVVVSHTARLAATFGGQARGLLAEHGPKYFGVTVDPNTRARDDWRVAGHKGGMRTFGVGGGITGSGADRLIIDDAIKNAEQAISPVYRENVWQWWLSSAHSRLEPDAAVIVMFTRWHEDDLAGRLLAQAEESGEHWTIIRLPAIAGENDQLGRQPGEALWPERMDLEYLENKRLNNTPYWWGAQYQQTPGTYGEAAWPADYFEDIWATEDEWPKRFQVSAIAIDPSKGVESRKGDFCAMVFVGIYDHKLWVDARLSKIPAPEIVRQGLDWYIERRPDLFAIEKNQFQDLFIDIFAQAARERGDAVGPLNVIGLENRVNKDLRIERLSPQFARHKVKFRQTGGNRELLRQLREFPNCDHDDGPDAMEMAVRVISDYGAPQPETASLLGGVA